MNTFTSYSKSVEAAVWTNLKLFNSRNFHDESFPAGPDESWSDMQW